MLIFETELRGETRRREICCIRKNKIPDAGFQMMDAGCRETGIWYPVSGIL